MSDTPKHKSIYEPVSIEAQERLMQIMNDSPSLVKLANAEWEIRALKPAVQYEICAEACKMVKIENASFGDVLKEIGGNFKSVVRIITLCLLNDKKRIENDYDTIYDLLMWESEQKDWANLLFEMLNLCDVSCFFLTTNAIQMFRAKTTKRKMTMAEQKLLLQGQNLVK